MIAQTRLIIVVLQTDLSIRHYVYNIENACTYFFVAGKQLLMFTFQFQIELIHIGGKSHICSTAFNE
jgi:hypothetical protein